MDYEKKYKESMAKMSIFLAKHDGFTISKDGEMYKELSEIFPELAENKDEMIRKEIIYHIQNCDDTIDEETGKRMLAWLEKQGEMDMESYKAAEDEKREFIGDGFIKCYANFQDFKEGETYWLEYVGNDNYNVRSDNLLGKTYHITPCQLYTIFKKQTWIEKQGSCSAEWKKNTVNNKPAFNHSVLMKTTHGIAEGEWNGKEWIQYRWSSKIKDSDVLYWMNLDELEKQSEQKPADKVEPKFKVGDWVIYKRGIVDQIANVKSVTNHSYGYETVNGEYFNDYVSGVKLWTIQDAKNGDVLVSSRYGLNDWICIFKSLEGEDDMTVYCFLSRDKRFVCDPVLCNGKITDCTPITKEQHDTFFKAMKKEGYEWDAEKKELRKIVTPD